ncbi:hypothetical protein PVAP13_2NG440000 [Panicum virgatum]|uniref:Uncharacterized protein n=1 Tax=Panicum virgatum TaxID=38727 RepID=A0A8T0VXZ8_PANVG|nr:hypothetical protein PVAP13_2NG440000 [Panicum virgatum]
MASPRHSPSSLPHRPLSPRSRAGAASSPTSPASPTSPPGFSPGSPWLSWWPGSVLDSPISTLEAPITPTYSLDSPSYSPLSYPNSPDHYRLTSLNYGPEGFSDRGRTSPAPVTAPCPTPTSQIHGDCPAAYSPTAPGYGPEYFNFNCNCWNHTSPAWGSPGYRPTSPIHGYYCSEAYSPTAPGYGPVEFATPEYCYCCSVPVEYCCCQAGDDDAGPSQ